MKTRNTLILSLIAISFWQCTSYKATKIDHSNRSIKNTGITYNLPQTSLKIDVTIEKETKIKGPFAEYAEKLLGLKNVIAYNQSTFKVANITVTGINTPDSSQNYLITRRGFRLCKRPTKYNFNELGNLTQINMRSTHQKTGVSKTTNSFSITPSSVGFPDFFKLYADASQIEKIDTVYETIKMDTIVMSKPIIKRTLVTKTVQQRAEEAADYILKFRIKRYELISATQEIAYSKEAFEYMTNQLIRLENDYLNLFTGITQTETQHYSFSITPTCAMQNQIIPLFNFSQENGVTDSLANNSESYSIQFNTLNTYKKDTIPTAKKSLIPYRNPEITKIQFIINGNTFPQTFTIPIHQFGAIRHFPRGVKSITINNENGLPSEIRIK